MRAVVPFISPSFNSALIFKRHIAKRPAHVSVLAAVTPAKRWWATLSGCTPLPGARAKPPSASSRRASMSSSRTQTRRCSCCSSQPSFGLVLLTFCDEEKNETRQRKGRPSERGRARSRECVCVCDGRFDLGFFGACFFFFLRRWLGFISPHAFARWLLLMAAPLQVHTDPYNVRLPDIARARRSVAQIEVR